MQSDDCSDDRGPARPAGPMTPAHETSPDRGAEMMHFKTTVHVDGMTCGHCIAAVTEELESLDGVEGVSVDLNAGGISEVTIDSDRKLKHEAISEAVAEAGYLVVDNQA